MQSYINREVATESSQSHLLEYYHPNHADCIIHFQIDNKNLVRLFLIANYGSKNVSSITFRCSLV